MNNSPPPDALVCTDTRRWFRGTLAFMCYNALLTIWVFPNANYFSLALLAASWMLNASCVWQDCIIWKLDQRLRKLSVEDAPPEAACPAPPDAAN